MSKQIQFGQREGKANSIKWEVKHGQNRGPGPNDWNEENVTCDSNGIHLKITKRKRTSWHCAELYTLEEFHFGTFQFDVVGQIDKFDPNVSLGMFTYGGMDYKQEIDIEIARWGYESKQLGNYCVYPDKDRGSKHCDAKYIFPLTLERPYTHHRFTWTSQQVHFESFHDHCSDNGDKIDEWIWNPGDTRLIPQKPAFVHINLWLCGGNSPLDKKEVSVTIKNFLYKPL